MRRLSLSLLLICAAASAVAHHPDRQSKPVHPRIDVIGPLGNRLPASHRRKYNRPTYVGGKVAYWIAPSSLEAMSWHAATHMNAYKNKSPRVVKYYFYPKPWEALRVGPRVAVGQEAANLDPPADPILGDDVPTVVDDEAMELPAPIE